MFGVMVAAPDTISVKARETLAGSVAWSDTLTLNVYVPAVAGVPVSAPVCAFKLSPGGKEADCALNVYGEISVV